MPPAGYAALFFTVLLLVTTAYFLMGGLPLLILKHDTPVDAGFIRGFFDVYYKAAFFAASGACLSYALWGRPISLSARLASCSWWSCCVQNRCQRCGP